jgi:hypothetical protein
MNTPAILCPLLLLLTACGNPQPVEMPADPPEPFVKADEVVVDAAPAVPVLVANGEQAQAALGQKVRVMGVAADAKLSAVVQSEELLVYCMGKGAEGMLVETRWPEEVVGQRVAVTGLLERSEQFMAVTGPDGAITQGTDAPILALVDYTHELVVAVDAAMPEVEPELVPEVGPEPEVAPEPVPEAPVE